MTGAGAEAEQALGYAAFRNKDFAAARGHFARAHAQLAATLGEDHPQSLTALSDVGAACAMLEDHAAARAAHAAALAGRRRVLGPRDPAVASSLHNLGLALRDQGALSEAAAAHAQALAIWRDTLPPTHPLIVKALVALGSVARARGDLAACVPFYEAAIAADPGHAQARHALAQTLRQLGRDTEAALARAQALRLLNVFVQPALHPVMTVLIPSLDETGNVPVEFLLPDERYTRIWWFLGTDRGTKPPALPPYDIVFNGVADPDSGGAAVAVLQHFAASCRRPFLNPPDKVARTRRDLLPALANAIPGLLIPAISRLPGRPTRASAKACGIAPPVLLRPAGTHGGEGLRLLENWEAWEDVGEADAWYLSAYHDCQGPDGSFRKYRVVFVDRVPFPYHLAISPNWLVHYFSADMPAHPWKLAEEAAFLADPARVLGPVAWGAVAALGKALDLDYAGVDFAVLPDGRALIFEANATMLVHPEAPDGPLAFKNTAVSAIVAAVAGMLAGQVARE